MTVNGPNALAKVCGNRAKNGFWGPKPLQKLLIYALKAIMKLS